MGAGRYATDAVPCEAPQGWGGVGGRRARDLQRRVEASRPALRAPLPPPQRSELNGHRPAAIAVAITGLYSAAAPSRGP
jgi:hypothetical protein